MTNRANKKRWMKRAGYAAVVLTCAFAVAGCKKKAPPPPAPPPPPPPPPPVVIDYDGILKDIKADPRVQVAKSVAVTDDSFARASATFADAFIRGDANKLKPMLTKRGQSVMTELQSSGRWDDAYKDGKVEAVRLVYADAPGSMSNLEFEKAVEAMVKANAEAMRRWEAELEARGIEPEYRAKMVAAQNEANLSQIAKHSLDDMTNLAGPKAEMVMLMAVQTPAGSDLLGWTASKADDKWVFNNASTTAQVQPKASDWDSVGMLGFSLGTGKSKEKEKAVEPAKTGEGGQGGNPGKPSAPGNPVNPGGPTKRTPAGPVTIPGG
ncbi:MAG: hypothetical protein ACREJO_14905 [Phycisphaerales bacterium]